MLGTQGEYVVKRNRIAKIGRQLHNSPANFWAGVISASFVVRDVPLRNADCICKLSLAEAESLSD